MQRLKYQFINIGMIVISIIFALLFSESFLRLINKDPLAGAGSELYWIRKSKHDLTHLSTIDPDFGFRPILGNGVYNNFGTLCNNHSLKNNHDKLRLLFIGDSVTARGKIINELMKIYGLEKFEYWNAGVESFNTVQEVQFYKKYNYLIKPDHVILTFHLNDFETTPIAYFNEEKRLVVYAPNQPLQQINPWLFRNTLLYRFMLGSRKNITEQKEAITKEVQENLIELKEILQQDGIAFSVVVLPLFIPYENWTQSEKKARDKIIRILQIQHIRYFDLLSPLQEAISQGIDVQEIPGESWHPNEKISEVFALYLFRHNIFNNGNPLIMPFYLIIYNRLDRYILQYIPDRVLPILNVCGELMVNSKLVLGLDSQLRQISS